MPKNLLHCPYVVTALQQMDGKGMSTGVAGGMLGNIRILYRHPDNFLKDRWV
jgi:hypothetical protein